MCALMHAHASISGVHHEAGDANRVVQTAQPWSVDDLEHDLGLFITGVGLREPW